jgi:diguanylate cyclase (GGDEF)-like protein
LPKREVFIKEIEKLIKEKTSFAIAIIDINKLKKVNAVLGFWAGDKAIKKLADFLKNSLEKSFVARIGGDEFGVIIKGDKSEIFKMLDKILSFNEEITQINGSEVYLSISVGVAFYPDDSRTKEELILKAERALEMTKKKGGKGISYANKNIDIMPKDYLELEKELKEAIKNDEYVMYYQPIIDIKNNKVWGAEALLRWHSKKRGIVSPAKFIPILEESGLINEVGDVIIEKVLKDIKVFEDKNINFIISMNVSGIQLLSQNLALKLIQKINEMKIKKELVILEITESVLMENIELIMPQIKLLQKEGIKIEIDDFGTGYSSLAYLKKLPISALKIDRAFVKDILVDEEDAQIVKAIISMAKSLNKKTIAEGAETKEVVEELKKLGVDYIQGFYFAKPMPKEELKEYLNSF